MIGAEEFSEIVAMYEKHGWVLRRVLLSGANPRQDFSMPADVGLVDSDIDAAWFSRPPRPGAVSWEIRSLGATPFALVVSVDESSPDFEYVLDDAKTRMAESLATRKRLDN